MKYAIISDIHGNLAALQQVQQHIQGQGCDRIVCLGDIVGYGPFPNECCDIIQQITDFSIIGNHDHAALGLTSTNYFNKYAAAAIRWTANELDDSSISFLKQLPLQKQEEDLLFVHASPIEPEEWNYVLSLYDAIDTFRAFSQQICFIGHSHVPVIYSYEEGEFPTSEAPDHLEVLEVFRYIINVGSVGQPRDRNADACYGVYDSEAKTFALHRVAYDIFATQEAMRERGLPEFLIDRLRVGR